MPRTETHIDTTGPDEAHRSSFAPKTPGDWSTVPDTEGEALDLVGPLTSTAVTAAAALTANTVPIGVDGTRAVKDSVITVSDSGALVNIQGTGALVTMQFVDAGGIGSFAWVGAADYFGFADAVMFATNLKLYFRATTNYIQSNAAGELTITAPTLTTIGAAGASVLGDFSGGNYSQFAADGLMTMAGTARVTKGEWSASNGLKAPGNKPATSVDYGIGDAFEFTDATDDTVVARIKIPEDMDRTVAPSILVGWSTPTGSAGNGRWQVEYLYRQENEAMDAAADATLVGNFAASATAKGLTMSTIGALAVPHADDVCVVFRIKRRADEAADTLGEDCHLHGICLTYTVNKLGTAT